MMTLQGALHRYHCFSTLRVSGETLCLSFRWQLVVVHEPAQPMKIWRKKNVSLFEMVVNENLTKKERKKTKISCVIFLATVRIPAS